MLDTGLYLVFPADWQSSYIFQYYIIKYFDIIYKIHLQGIDRLKKKADQPKILRLKKKSMILFYCVYFLFLEVK